ncbi:MAG: membrane protein insertase YidC [Rhodobacteraceae bacterium]|nr:MAG: membrane protein insertase YidC [Paracoccaceae bacterium]
MSDQKNMIMAAALSFVVILVWQVFFAPPAVIDDATQVAERAFDGAAAPQPLDGTPGTVEVATPEAALAAAERIDIRTPKLSGTLSLKGGRIDELSLLAFRETLDPDSPNVELLTPFGAQHPYYAVWGWIPTRDAPAGPTPGADTLWSVESGDALSPGRPVTLVWDNGSGLVFRRTMRVDENYMFTIEQSVENLTDRPVTLAPYGIIARHGVPPTIGFYILHEGGIGMTDGRLHEFSYSNILDLARDPAEGGPAERLPVASNGWLGFTDKYWLAAMAGGPDRPFTAVFRAVETAQGPVFQSDLRQPAVTVAPGAAEIASSFFFAGAKDTRLLQAYERDLGIDGLINAVDWGWFFFLTKPIFQLLMIVNDVIGNMGWSIIALTFIIKAALFPLAWKSFVSMSKMKQLQPEMEKLKERCGDDKQKLQQEMIALYRKEKVNPASGCLPILLQIPIFFSLYKVFFVTLELRHAPWIGWIRDLSAPDPTSWMNLFGLLPFSADSIPGILSLLSIGVLPIIMGVTMWMQQKLNPAPTDPIQAQIFAIMPFMFMFLLGSFASGLVLYWIANNVITFSQQYAIMRSQGVQVDFLGNVKRSFRRRKPAE